MQRFQPPLNPNRTQGNSPVPGFLTARRAPRAGFTLVEMLLVLAVLLIFAGIAFPLLSGTYDRHQLDQVVEEVRRDLAGTRTFAVESGVTYQFRYEPGGQRYLIVPYEVDTDVGTGTGTGGQSVSLTSRYRMYSRKLPAGYTFVDATQDPTQQQSVGTFLPIRDDILKTFPNANELNSASGWPAVLFSFDGSASASTLAIKGENKLSRSLSVRELTGAVSVGELKQERW